MPAAFPFVARKMTPRSRKSGSGLLSGCRLSLDAGPFETTFFDDVHVIDVQKIKMNSNCWPKTGIKS